MEVVIKIGRPCTVGLLRRHAEADERSTLSSSVYDGDDSGMDDGSKDCSDRDSIG